MGFLQKRMLNSKKLITKLQRLLDKLKIFVVIPSNQQANDALAGSPTIEPILVKKLLH